MDTDFAHEETDKESEPETYGVPEPEDIELVDKKDLAHTKDSVFSHFYCD